MYDKAHVSGGHKKENASAAAIGATAGVSLGFVAIAIPLAILYMRNKHKQLHREIDLSEDFLYDSTEESSSYSYSYYTYEYEYTATNDECSEYNGSNESYQLDSSASYSDFNGAYMSTELDH